MNILFRHVQINNDSAIKFYEKHGFKIVEKKDNYYKRIEPADAFVLQKDLRDVGVIDTSCAQDSSQSCGDNKENINDMYTTCTTSVKKVPNENPEHVD